MRVVHLAKYFYPEVGGIENVVLALARGAVAVGHAVSVVAFSRGPSARRQILDGVSVLRYRARLSIASQPLSLWYCLGCLREASKADVIHVHMPNIVALVACLLTKRSASIVTHWHSDIVGKGVLGMFVRPLERALARRSTRIIATTVQYAAASPVVCRHLVKTDVVPIGCPDYREVYSAVRPSDDPFVAELAAEVKGKRIVLAVGRLVRFKGYDVLLRAIPQMDDDVLGVVVGDGPERQRLVMLATELGIQKRVLFLGRLGPLRRSHDGVVEEGRTDVLLHYLYSAAALLCFPSIERAESFGISMLEAMCYGLPIVASDILGSGVPWVNRHGVSGINIPPAQPTALATACREVLRDRKLAKHLSDGGRNRFETEFREEMSVGRVVRIYDAVIRAPARGC